MIITTISLSTYLLASSLLLTIPSTVAVVATVKGRAEVPKVPKVVNKATTQYKGKGVSRFPASPRVPEFLKLTLLLLLHLFSLQVRWEEQVYDDLDDHGSYYPAPSKEASSSSSGGSYKTGGARPAVWGKVRSRPRFPSRLRSI